MLIILIPLIVVRNPKWLGSARFNAEKHARDLLVDGFLTADDLANMDAGGLKGEFWALVELAYLDTALFGIDEGVPMKSLVDLLLGMDCRFLNAPDGSEFVTSSCPVYAEWFNEAEENPYVIYFPLSPRYAAVFQRQEGREYSVFISHVNKAEAESLNRCLVNRNDFWDCLIARDKTVLERLLES